ncbi:hypothetical protein F0562_011943 [Nyssa sinensis]|uniref:Protein kinase domain-containing protein n=1 Tax=Nyssa sinensis TaxID=561372 RepID=A0A5J4ZS16_9ASTE|nr:hypothetical protein F0562_011943 [Nyssa sinensis]
MLQNFASAALDKAKKWIWIGTAAAMILVVILSCLLCLMCHLRKRQKRKQRLQAGEDETEKEKDQVEIMIHNIYRDTNDLELELELEENKDHDLKAFSFACMIAATRGFSSDSKLGEGGFGPVYKGELPGDQKVAVKRLSRSSGQGLVEFKNELTLIAKLQHRNLVQLLGYCIQGEEKMLIYEYMPNKSLDYFLFDPSKRSQLTWEIRFKIIEGIAQGLLYLHKYSRLRNMSPYSSINPFTDLGIFPSSMLSFAINIYIIPVSDIASMN